MPDHCCVPNCRSNYTGTNEYVTVFKFPNNEEQKKLWCRKIPRADFNPGKRSVVCEKHFLEQFIVRYDKLPKDGKVLKIRRLRPKLTPEAYPSIFEGYTPNLSGVQPKNCLNRDEQQESIDSEVFDALTKNDKIISFDHFLTEVVDRTREFNTASNVIIHVMQADVHFLFLNFLPVAKLEKCVKIDKFMNLCVTVREESLEVSSLKHILIEPGIINLWTELHNVLNYVKFIPDAPVNRELTEPTDPERAICYWKSFLNSTSDDHPAYDDKHFILEQMELSQKSTKAKRYSSSLTSFAYSLFALSSASYQSMHESNLIHLPSVRHLKRLASLLHQNQPRVEPNNISDILCVQLSTED